MVVDKNPKNNCNTTPLHEAASSGHKESVKILLDVVQDITPWNKFGQTPQSLAQMFGHTSICKLFDKTHYTRGFLRTNFFSS